MAIALFWDNEARTVLLCEFDRAWTWDDMYTTLDKIKQITDSADREIAAIIDMSKGANLPGGSLFSPSTLDHARRMLKMGEGGRAPVVVVGANPLIKTVYGTFRGLDRNGLSNVQFTNTVDEARDFLIERNHSYAPI